MREAYYNEFDPKAAAWLRVLIDKGHIAKGIVDERSISDVTPGDLEGYIQCHFFAGIGVWSHALRRAGWPDDRPVWTGSCPCQPFSAAGKGGGFADERHLWPAWHWLIDQCRPDTIFGEQVASKDGLTWFDLVSSDLEGSGYAVGASDMCAAGVGAPHIRQRLYFMAHPDNSGPQGRSRVSERPDQRLVGAGGMVGGLGDSQRGLSGWRPGEASGAQGAGGRVEEPGDHGPVDAGGGAPLGMAHYHGDGPLAGRAIRPVQAEPDSQHGGDTLGVEHASGDGRIERGSEPSGRGTTTGRGADGMAYADGWERLGLTDRQGRLADGAQTGRVEGDGEPERDCSDHRPGPTNGFWRDADWLHGRDGKWRPVEPGTFPLADGSPARVGRLRGYGNAIVAPVAQAFIEECMK